MDTTQFIQSLQSLSNEELYRVKDRIVDQLNAVESLLMSRWKAEEHSAIANDLSHNGKFEVVYPEIDFEVPASSTSSNGASSTYDREQIDELLRTSDKAVERAIIRLFELQTADEQRCAQANHNNGVGFSKADSPAGTAFARYLLGFNWRNQRAYEPKSLNHPHALQIAQRGGRKGWDRYCHGERPIDRARRIALKHSAQLVGLANR